jgi:hypothetical protein
MNAAERDAMDTFKWVDTFTLSRPKRSIARDFADGVLVAEIIAQVKPFGQCVDLHNYNAASNLARKMGNWTALEHKVLRKLKMPLGREEMEAISVGVPGAIENFLGRLRRALTATAGGRVGTRDGGIDVDGDEEERQQQQRRVPEEQVSSVMPSMESFASIPATKYPELLARRDARVEELEETNEILATKVMKLEQLVRLKDAKIQALEYQLERANET